MPVKIIKIEDSTGKVLKNNESNVGATPPFTIWGTADKDHLIVLWLNKEREDMMPASSNEGEWSYKFTPKSNKIDVVAAQLGYKRDDNGTFTIIY